MSIYDGRQMSDWYRQQLHLQALLSAQQNQLVTATSSFSGGITWIGLGELQKNDNALPASDTKIPEGVLPGDGKMIGYIEAYRAWKFHISLARLRSDYMDEVVWEPKKPLKAINNGNHSTTHGGGIYASKTLAAIESSYKDRGQSIYGLTYHVLGKVALWGAIKEHKDGYRAEYAYPTQFIRVTNVAPEFEFVLIKALSDIYLPRR